MPPKAWIVIDADTGNVIDAGNDRTPLPPASLTKVITALAVVESLPPDVTDVPVSARAAAAPAHKISMKQGEVWPLNDTLNALLLSSANDAAVALAERTGGTVEGFQHMFSATADNLGMADHPVLQDPAGLDGPDGVDGGNLVSARDMAIAARALVNQPTLAAIVADPVYQFVGPDGVHHRLQNHNWRFLQNYAGAVGVKTGFTSRAGACLITAARRDGRTMVAVMLNAPNAYASGVALLDQGFATPVASESAADQLPPVHLGRPTIAGAPVPPAVTPATGVVKPPPPAPHRDLVASMSHVGGGWLLWLLVFVMGSVSLLRLRVRLRRRARRRAVTARRPASRPTRVSGRTRPSERPAARPADHRERTAERA